MARFLLLGLSEGMQMISERVSIQDLFPTARDLFKPNGQRRRPSRGLPLVTWLIAGALAALLGKRILHWADRNL